MKRRAAFASVMRSRYAMRLFVSSLVILVFALCSGLIMYSRASDLLKAETLRLNEQILNDIATKIEEKLKNASAYVYNAATNSAVQVATMDDQKDGKITLEHFYTAYKQLYSLYHNHFSDLFVYYANSDYIISGSNSSTNRELYAKTFYKNADFSKERFSALINSAYYATVLNLDQTSRLAVAQTVPMQNTRRYTALAVCVLGEALPSFTGGLSPESVFTITDARGQTLYSSAPEIDIREGDKYLAESYTSADTGLTYLYALPESVFWKQLKTLRSTTIMIMSLFLAVGSLITYIISRQNYKPIGTLVSAVSGDGAASSERISSDIAYLRQALTSVKDERRRISDVRKEHFVNRALIGLYDSAEDVVSEFLSYGIELRSDRFMVFALLPEASVWDPPGTRAYSEGLMRDEFEAALGERGLKSCGMLINSQPKQYSYLLNVPKGMEALALESGRRFQTVMREKHELKITVACGECLCGWEGLARSYTLSNELLSLRAIYGAGSFITPPAEGAPAFNYRFLSGASTEAALISFVRSGTPEPDAILAQFKRDCCDGEMLLPSEFQCYSHDLCALMCKVSRQLGCADSGIDPLFNCDNLPDFDNCLVCLLHELREAYGLSQLQRNEAAEMELCRNIIAFIERHYGEASLCIEQISAHFKLSGAYLNKRFKLVSGLSIPSYIAYVRVEHAKRLLTNTRESIESLSIRLGFLDSSAFIRVFKKNTDMTPGTYRKLYQEQV